MKGIISLVLLFSASSSAVFAASDILPDQKVMEKIAKTIKSPLQEKGDISLKYNFAPASKVDINNQGKEPSKDKLNFDIQLLDRDPKLQTPAELIDTGYKLALEGQYDKAIFLYKKALEADKGNYEIIYSIGTLYHKMGQFADAKSCYKQVLEKKPDHKKALNNFIAIIGESQPDEALVELKSLEQANPYFSPVLAQMGLIYARKQDHKKAEEYLNKAIQLSPHEMLYRYNLAVMYDKISNIKAALKFYKDLLNSYASSALPVSYQEIKERIAFLEREQLQNDLQG